MNICIIATICKETGALTIYKQLIKQIQHVVKEKHRFYIFVDPSMPMPRIDGAEYIAYDTRGIKRFRFDGYDFKKICIKRGIKPDVIFSLNNSGVRYKGVRQIVYYHQALPLYPNCFSPLKPEERGMWLFHYYYPKYVELSLRKNTDVVVQTSIISNLFSKKYRFPQNRIHIAFPDVEQVDVENVEPYKLEYNTINFLYPATSPKYKEHATLTESINLIKDGDIRRNVRIHLTLRKGEYIELEKLIEKYGLQELFVFHGPMPHENLLSMYKAADGLLFPSTIETIGLPLLEAAAFGLPVIANDLDYVKDVLKNYEGLKLVHMRDYNAWGEAILKICNEKPRYTKYQRAGGSDWPKVLQLLFKKMK